MGGTSSKEMLFNNVSRLLKQDVSPSDHDFWDDLWKTTVSTEDIFYIIHPENVRIIVNERPNNLKTLFSQAVAQLYQVVETPYPVYFEQALTCARILSRFLPFMLESKSKFITDLFWKSKGKRRGSDASTENSEDTVESNQFAAQHNEPLAVILINALFHLLFLPDFTIDDPNVDFSEDQVNSPEFKMALMWAPGVGSSEKSVTTSTQYDTIRIDILRLMVASFSGALYQSPESYDSCSSFWLEVATSADVPYAEIAFYSLMNTVLGEIVGRSCYDRNFCGKNDEIDY
jgi:hypothetical protein